ncbi:hypothetical protein CROQUDRAFT_49456 [Cronartium quercuum f. sp. fusiforme G11]|uniref:ABC transporter n=1 Tax=Cronartium quercuum f. sp. fusiforme G11 TaxID=708437 RepID=A0A9P6NG30_9BASI|nr:hypothetical protein CROQUDRAFT_49456 [Cronartium quercuum f. sp. fusiforme G11]
MGSYSLQLATSPFNRLKLKPLYRGRPDSISSIGSRIQYTGTANPCFRSRLCLPSNELGGLGISIYSQCPFPATQLRTFRNEPTRTQSFKTPSAPQASDNSLTSQTTEVPEPSSKISFSELKRLASLAKPEKKLLGIAGGLLLVSSSVSLSVPFLWGKVIDVFTSPELSQSLSLSLPAAAGLMTGFFLVGAGANTARVILMRIAGQRIVQRIRKSAFNSVIKSDITWHDLRGAGLTKGQGGTGDLVSRLGSDSSIVGDSISRDLADGVRSLITSLAGVSMMFYISSKLTLVMLTVVPPTAIGAVFFGRYLKKLSRLTQEGLGEMINFSEERLNQVRTVHSFNAVPLEQKTFSDKVDEIFDLARKEAFASGLGFTGNLTVIALLTYGGTLVSRGEISVGDLSSLMLYTAYVGGSLMGLSSWFATIMKGLGASSRIFELLDAQPASVVLGLGTDLHSSEPLRKITFKDVRFEYPARPGAEILKGLDLQIQPGTSLAIAGSSGSGKSTIAHLLLRFYDPKAGQVVYGDEDIRTFTPESWRANFGLVPQDPALLSGTIASNITYGLSSPVAQSTLEQCARLANALEFINALPKQFDTEIGPKGMQLSGGQRQRLAIARALIRQPKLLILDEATSALDTASENEVNLAIQRVMNERSLTTVIIAHRLSTLKTADRIIFVDDGKVLESGTYADLSKDGTAFNAMVKSQLLGVGLTDLPSKPTVSKLLTSI